jgi:hypothetical protein
LKDLAESSKKPVSITKAEKKRVNILATNNKVKIPFFKNKIKNKQ